MKEKGKLLSVLFLCLSLIAMPMQPVFAEDEEPEPENPPEVVYQISGTVYQHAYASSESSGTAQGGIPVEITLATDTVTLVSESDGSFEYVFADDSERTESGEYSWLIASDENHYDASGTLEEGTEDEPVVNKLYVRERYIPTSSDYKFVESDNVKKIGNKTWVREPGTYAIQGTTGRKLTKILDGVASDTINISVSASGALENFFIYVGSLCSKILTGQKVYVDAGAPEIDSVSTEAANNNTYVKEHGIYGRTKAEIILTASITEESAIDEVYLISETESGQRRYDATKITGENGKYEATIGLPDAETIMDAQLVKLVAVDIFGKKSSEVLIAQTEAGSSVTLEQVPPNLAKKTTGKHSAYNWYSELPTLSATASDNLSGLASLEIYGIEGGSTKSIVQEAYPQKTTAEHSIEGVASFDEVTDDGLYTFTAKAVDNAGNETTEDFNIYIDLVAPVITATGAVSGTHYNTNPVIRITETEKYYAAKGNRIFVKVTRDGVVVLDKTYEQVNSATIPQETFDKDGVYAVNISAKDAADNASNAISYTFTKDATAPKVAISGVKEGKYYNKPQTVTVTVTEHNYSTNDVSVTATKKLNGTKNVGFPWKNKAEVSENSKKFSETGTYTVTASAKDKAGNQSAQKKVSFTVDTKAPEITITGVQDKGVYKYGQGLAPKVTVADDYLASKSIVYTKAGQTIANPSFAQIKENDGLYTLTVSATDKAGNSSKKQISFVVNRFGSWFEYNDAIKNLADKAVHSVDADLVITERNVSKVTDSDLMIYRDGKAISDKGSTQKSEGAAENVYRHVFGKELFTDEGAYEINVISRDEVGNEMESSEENGKVTFFVDRTAPTILVTGIDPKGIKAESADLGVDVSDLLTGVTAVAATVDGSPKGLEETASGYTLTLGQGLRQKIRITATDGAGNEAVYEITVSVSTNAAALFFDRFKVAIGLILAAVIAGGVGFFFLAKKKKRDEENDDDDEEIKDTSEDEN